MPHEKRQFENGELYHVTTRRIGNELLFGDINDYYRGIFSIYEFNNSNPVEIWRRRRERASFKAALKQKSCVGGLPSHNYVHILEEPDKRDKLVAILDFTLMPNHIHMLLEQLKENGISRFMQKFGSGYAVYFKEKYQIKIKGHFFQDRFHRVHVKTDNQLRTAFVYDHTNPIAVIETNWKEQGIKNPARVIKFLEGEYRWSSYWDYIGKKNFPSVTSRDFLLEVMGGVEGCRRAVNDWIAYKGDISRFKELGLP